VGKQLDLAVFQLLHRNQLLHQIRELLGCLLETFVQSVLLAQFLQHRGAVEAPVIQNQVAEAVVVAHGFLRMYVPVYSQPVRVYLYPLPRKGQAGCGNRREPVVSAWAF
jgi:hypothetical protein